ncbi:MAG: DNA alkylation repair protein [Spirochaetia bacterium]|nr:DNA alkylation repair protein [Spirochaetia bacterium]
MKDTVLIRLLELQDLKYRDFQSRLMPDISKENIIGVRTPLLRSMAKELNGTPEAETFLQILPHRYFDENQLHSFLISLNKNFDSCIEQTELFLPYIDNWATSDQLSPKIFKKHKPELMEHIRKWLKSDRTYTLRFGTGMLMEHFLDEDFRPEILELAASVHSSEYYVNMMTAWFFATALTKQYDATLPYITQRRLDTWVHNKTIQKAIESYRISDAQKTLLRQMKA